MLTQLLDEITLDAASIRKEMVNGGHSYVIRFLDSPEKYLVAPDLKPGIWSNLDQQRKEAFYLFILMNELHSKIENCRNFLRNVSMYFPKEMNLAARLRLFASLVRITHVQGQYIEKSLEFFKGAEAVYGLSDDYLQKASIRTVLIQYYRAFIALSRSSLHELGQEKLLESVLPEIGALVASNNFVRDAVLEIIQVIKGEEEGLRCDILFVFN